MTKQGELRENERHPSYELAVRYISTLPLETLMKYQESFCSCAIEGNRLGEICGTTLGKLLREEPVGERYVLGLALTLMDFEERNRVEKQEKRD